MKFKCPKPMTWAERCAYMAEWRDWFAWHPVRVGDGTCRWLEVVQRSGQPGYERGWDWTYRAKN